jgi:hypothetical protein
MEAAGSAEALVTMYQYTRCHIAEKNCHSLRYDYYYYYLYILILLAAVWSWGTLSL